MRDIDIWDKEENKQNVIFVGILAVGAVESY